MADTYVAEFAKAERDNMTYPVGTNVPSFSLIRFLFVRAWCGAKLGRYGDSVVW